jgi:hypothetical protein
MLADGLKRRQQVGKKDLGGDPDSLSVIVLFPLAIFSTR